MLHKFALALKSKTVEFFAEEEEEEDYDDRISVAAIDLDSTEEIITGQRVVVIKPDEPTKPTSSYSDHRQLQQSLVPSLFTAVSSFHAAYLQLQAAHEPFDQDGIESADRAAVSHLQHLCEHKRAYTTLPKSPNSPLPLSSQSEAQVQENQSMLRMFETVFNRLQSDIDRKDAEVAALKQELMEIESSNSFLERKLNGLCSPALIEEENAFLSIGVFDAVVKESCRAAHSFAKVLIDLMKNNGWDLDLAANSIYPNVDYAKRGHCRYALLSYICLLIFGGFGTDGFGVLCKEDRPNGIEPESPRRNFLGQFVKHLTVDALELLDTRPDCEFAKFCENKYRKLVHLDLESSLFGKLHWTDPVLRSWQQSNPLYEPFVTMCSSVWMLHKLALAMAFDRPVKIFQVGQGADFQVVYMENVVRRFTSKGSSSMNVRPKVGFTVFPGFCVGNTVIQCRVYLNYTNCAL